MNSTLRAREAPASLYKDCEADRWAPADIVQKLIVARGFL
jgi:hypothetical protein